MIQIIQILEMYLLPQVSSGYGAYPLCNLTQPAACGYVINAAKNEESLTELREINWRYQVRRWWLISYTWGTSFINVCNQSKRREMQESQGKLFGFL